MSPVQPPRRRLTKRSVFVFVFWTALILIILLAALNVISPAFYTHPGYPDSLYTPQTLG